MHIGETNIFSFFTKCNDCDYKKNIFWILFVSSTGLLEAFKETTEGAKFFKEEACKGIVLSCVYVHNLSGFVCLFVFFFSFSSLMKT